MSLPFSPQDWRSLRSRFPDALRQVYDVESMLLGVWSWPWAVRANVFDFGDGLRLVAWLQVCPAGLRSFRVSAELIAHTPSSMDSTS